MPSAMCGDPFLSCWRAPSSGQQEKDTDTNVLVQEPGSEHLSSHKMY